MDRGNQSSKCFKISRNVPSCASGSLLLSRHRPARTFAQKLFPTTTVSVSPSHGCGCIQNECECPCRPTHLRALPSEKGVQLMQSFGCSTGSESCSVSTANIPIHRTVCKLRLQPSGDFERWASQPRSSTHRRPPRRGRESIRSARQSRASIGSRHGRGYCAATTCEGKARRSFRCPHRRPD